MDLQKPSVGRIVHYTTHKGTVRAAMIVRVWGEHATSACNLRVFTDYTNDGPGMGPDGSTDSELAAGAQTGAVWKTSVSQAEDGNPAPGKWHFPPRV